MPKDKEHEPQCDSGYVATGGVRKLFNGKEFNDAVVHILAAAKEAESSTCAIEKRGAVVVKDKGIVGRGYNGPNKGWDGWPKKICSDKNSCPYKNGPYKNGKRLCLGLHAELRAILGAPREELEGATVYHVRIDKGQDGNWQIVPSRSTITDDKKACSDCVPKLREVGIAEIGIVIAVAKVANGGKTEIVPTEIHMIPIDNGQNDAYFSTAFSDLIRTSIGRAEQSHAPERPIVRAL